MMRRLSSRVLIRSPEAFRRIERFSALVLKPGLPSDVIPDKPRAPERRGKWLCPSAMDDLRMESGAVLPVLLFQGVHFCSVSSFVIS